MMIDPNVSVAELVMVVMETNCSIIYSSAYSYGAKVSQAESKLSLSYVVVSGDVDSNTTYPFASLLGGAPCVCIYVFYVIMR